MAVQQILKIMSMAQQLLLGLDLESRNFCYQNLLEPCMDLRPMLELYLFLLNHFMGMFSMTVNGLLRCSPQEASRGEKEERN